MAAPHAHCACLLLSLAACSATGDPSNSEAPAKHGEQAEAPVVVESEPARAPSDGEGGEYFLAVLGQTGIEHCEVEFGYESTWLAVEPTLGFVRAGGPGFEPIDAALYDQPVLARGHTAEPPPRPALDVEPNICGQIQMRSDWVKTPRGIRILRDGDRSALPRYFHVSSIRRLDELAVRREGEEIVVDFRNPLPVALDGVALVMHYEGCYGKPGTTSREAPKRSLDPGALTSHRFALFVELDHPGPRKGGPTARKHRAARLSLTIEAADGVVVHTDFAVSLNDLGLAFDCP